MKNKTIIIAAFAAIILIGTASILIKKSSTKNSGKTLSQTNVENSTFGNSKDEPYYELAKFTVSRSNSQIIKHKAYTVDYNKGWLLPNWVGYSLANWQTQGPVERYTKFQPDPQVEGVSAQYWDYKYSGYDRGHMCPAGDMKWDETAMMESFYLSNICPQDHTLNEGDWHELEKRVRGWARSFDKVYVICGPIVAENPQVIGQHQIAVPDSFFKVVLCEMKKGDWQAIGFVFPNNSERHSLLSYCRTVDYIENLTGIDFFYNLPDRIENKIEHSYDAEKWKIR